MWTRGRIGTWQGVPQSKRSGVGMAVPGGHDHLYAAVYVASWATVAQLRRVGSLKAPRICSRAAGSREVKLSAAVTNSAT